MVYLDKKVELDDIENELLLLGTKVAKANKDNFINISERMEVLDMKREEILKDIGMSKEEYIDMNAEKGTTEYHKTLEFLKERFGVLKPL